MNVRSLVAGSIGVAVFVVAWQAATWGNDVSDLPGPWLSVKGLWELAAAGVLWKNLVASVFRVAWGFSIAVCLGIPIGMLMGWTIGARESINPTVQCLRPISPIAWLPFATVMFGGSTVFVSGNMRLLDASDNAAIFLIFLASFFPIVTATTSAVRSVEQKYLRSASNFGVGGIRLFRRVIFPAALPQILTGLRLALGVAWVVIVAAEMLGVTSGLGYQVNDSRNNLRFDYVAAAMIVIGLTGLFLDSLMARIESAALAKRGITKP